jgi:arsenite transporter
MSGMRCPDAGAKRKADTTMQGKEGSMRADDAATQQHEPGDARGARSDPLGLFGRYLSIWVAWCIVAGIGLGNFFPGAFEVLSRLEIARVNLVVAVLIWIMIYPMMVNVDFLALRRVGDRPKGLVITVVVNWLIKPFTMAGLGVLFFEFLFRDLITPADAKQYIAGLILLGAAPCTAMVFVWSQLTRGDATYTLVQVSLNDVIMIFAFAPIVALLLGVTDLIVPWETLLLSVVLYVVIPLGAGYLTRRGLSAAGNEKRVQRFTAALRPYTILGLLATVVLLFAFQGQSIIGNPVVILLIALPLIVQSYGIFFVGYGWAWLWGVPFQIAAPAALIGTSNFFELAVAVAVSLFGLNSGAALATVVGVLVEVPVMLSLVAIANRTQGRFEPQSRPRDLRASRSPRLSP